MVEGSEERRTTGLGLLMFNLEENEDILRNARALSTLVDEIVVVDSSSPGSRKRLAEELRPLGGRVVPVLPLGFVDPLRSFGVAQMSSERVLLLDADEEVSPELRESLVSLRDSEAYVVPRFEVELRSYTYHLRLFRPKAVRYHGRSFDFPSVEGRIDHLDRRLCILHRAHYERYLQDKGREERYFYVENIERPFFRGYLRDSLTVRLGGRGIRLPAAWLLGGQPDGMLPGPMVRLVIEYEFLRDLLLGKGTDAALFNRRYSIGKWRFLEDLPDDERSRVREIAGEVLRAGGLLEYLGLGDPRVLETLTSSFTWDRRGIDVLRDLLAYRLRAGRPMTTFRPEGIARSGEETVPVSSLTMSIVIPTHDRPERVAALMSSIAKVSPRNLVGIIIVDDSDRPADYESMFPGLPIDHLTLGHRAFITHSKNLGWRRARSDLVYFIDDDNVVTAETFVEPLAAMAADPRMGAVVPAVLYRRRPDLVWVYATPWADGRWGHTLLGRNRPRAPALEGKVLETDALPNASLVRRLALEQTGGFSENLVVNSSADAAMRLKHAGWKVRAHTGAFILHDVDPPGDFGYWARHGAADPDRVYFEVRDWFLLMRSVHPDEPLFRLRATIHALGFMIPNGTTYLLRGGARGRASFWNLLRGYLGGLRATSRHA